RRKTHLLRRLPKIGEHVVELRLLLQPGINHLAVGHAALRILEVFAHGLVVPHDARLLHSFRELETLHGAGLLAEQAMQIGTDTVLTVLVHGVAGLALLVEQAFTAGCITGLRECTRRGGTDRRHRQNNRHRRCDDPHDIFPTLCCGRLLTFRLDSSARLTSMRPSALFFAALALAAGPALAAAEPVQIKPSLLRLNGNLEIPDGAKLAGENVVLLLHGTLSHDRQETIAALQKNLRDRGLA